MRRSIRAKRKPIRFEFEEPELIELIEPIEAPTPKPEQATPTLIQTDLVKDHNFPLFVFSMRSSKKKKFTQTTLV